MKKILIPLLFFTYSNASVLTLNELLEHAKEPRLLLQTIEEEQKALEAKNIASNADEPFVLHNGLTRANGKALSGYEYNVGISKELKLSNIQELESQQNRLNNEAHKIEQEKYLINASNRLKNLYHQYCLNLNFRNSTQENYDHFSLLYGKKNRAYQHGEIAKTELLQLELERNKLQSEVEIFQQQVEDEKHLLLSLTDLTQTNTLSCQDTYSINEQAVFDNSYMALTQKAFEKRIESRKVGLKRHSRDLESLEVSMGYTKELETDLYSVGISIPLNFSTNKSEEERASLMHEVSALSSQNEQMVAQKEYAVKGLQNKLRRLFTSINALTNNISHYQNALLPLMKKSYDYGESSVIEYLLSKQKLNNLQQELLEQQKSYYETLFQIYSMSELKEK